MLMIKIRKRMSLARGYIMEFRLCVFFYLSVFIYVWSIAISDII